MHVRGVSTSSIGTRSGLPCPGRTRKGRTPGRGTPLLIVICRRGFPRLQTKRLSCVGRRCIHKRGTHCNIVNPPHVSPGVSVGVRIGPERRCTARYPYLHAYHLSWTKPLKQLSESGRCDPGSQFLWDYWYRETCFTSPDRQIERLHEWFGSFHRRC